MEKENPEIISQKSDLSITSTFNQINLFSQNKGIYSSFDSVSKQSNTLMHERTENKLNLRKNKFKDHIQKRPIMNNQSNSKIINSKENFEKAISQQEIDKITKEGMFTEDYKMLYQNEWSNTQLDVLIRLLGMAQENANKIAIYYLKITPILYQTQLEEEILNSIIKRIQDLVLNGSNTQSIQISSIVLLHNILLLNQCAFLNNFKLKEFITSLANKFNMLNTSFEFNIAVNEILIDLLDNYEYYGKDTVLTIFLENSSLVKNLYSKLDYFFMNEFSVQIETVEKITLLRSYYNFMTKLVPLYLESPTYILISAYEEFNLDQLSHYFMTFIEKQVLIRVEGLQSIIELELLLYKQYYKVDFCKYSFNQYNIQFIKYLSIQVQENKINLQSNNNNMISIYQIFYNLSQIELNSSSSNIEYDILSLALLNSFKLVINESEKYIIAEVYLVLSICGLVYLTRNYDKGEIDFGLSKPINQVFLQMKAYKLSFRILTIFEELIDVKHYEFFWQKIINFKFLEFLIDEIVKEEYNSDVIEHMFSFIKYLLNEYYFKNNIGFSLKADLLHTLIKNLRILQANCKLSDDNNKYIDPIEVEINKYI